MIRYTRFIALGDSFTEGVGDIQVDGQFRGWADRVAERIALQQSDFSYLNLAIRGKLVAEVVDNQIGEAINWIQGPTTLVSFHAGANDVLRPGYNPEIVLPQYREAVRTLASTSASREGGSNLGRAKLDYYFLDPLGFTSDQGHLIRGWQGCKAILSATRSAHPLNWPST